MSVKFNCPHCKKMLAVNDYCVGQEVACPYCGEKTMAAPGLVDPSESLSLEFDEGEMESEFEAYEAEAGASDQEETRFDEIPSYLAGAILATLFCFAPFGIVAIAYAAQASTFKEMKNYEAAMLTSEKAGSWISYAFWTGLVLGFIYVAFLVTRFGG